MLSFVWLYQRMFILMVGSRKKKALEIAGHHYCDEFKGSNGWFDCWKKHYNVRQMKVSGYVSGATADSWKERPPDILQAKDIWNVNETGCFW